MARKKSFKVSSVKIQSVHENYSILENFAGIPEADGEYQDNQLEVASRALWNLLYSINANLYEEIKGDLDQLESKIQKAMETISDSFKKSVCL